MLNVVKWEVSIPAVQVVVGSAFSVVWLGFAMVEMAFLKGALFMFFEKFR